MPRVGANRRKATDLVVSYNVFLAAVLWRRPPRFFADLETDRRSVHIRLPHADSRRTESQNRISLRSPRGDLSSNGSASSCPALPHADSQLFAESATGKAVRQLAARSARQFSCPV